MINILLLVLGLVFGSFVTALSYRIPRGISFTKGRSVCDFCKAKISWYDNIPLVSYLMLGGKCRHCKKHISARYPAIELITAFGFLVIGLNLPYLVLFVILETIFIIDLEHQIIPDSLIFFGILVLLPFTGSLFSSLFAGFMAASFLMLIHLATRGRGMGLGDVKFAVLGGLISGLRLTPIWLFYSFVIGAMAGIVLMVLGKAGMKSKIAFGPFLIIGLISTLIWGNLLVQKLFGY